MKAQDQIEEETKVSVETLTVLREGRMPSLRPCCFLVFLWSLSFIVILAILIKVDFLRNRILVDEWTNSQEYTKLEAKAQWILRYGVESKILTLSKITYLFPEFLHP